MNATTLRRGLRGLLPVLMLVVIGSDLVRSEEPLSAEERQKLTDTANKLDRDGKALFARGDRQQALERFVEGLKVNERLFQGIDHSDLANSLNSVGFVLQALGQPDKALPYYDRALKMYERLAKNQDHPVLAGSLNNMGAVLKALGQPDKALPFYERSLQMYERLAGGENRHDLANSLTNMGSVLEALGQNDKALPFYTRALKMRERLFKNQDHTDVGSSLNSMGYALQLLGQPAKALPFYDRALKMRERLAQGEDHPALATSLNNMGSVLHLLGQADKALPFYDRALTMRERLFKDRDHPALAGSLNNLGSILESLGQADKALSFHDRALKMYERLAKNQDDPALAGSLINMGSALEALGQADKALPFYDRALKMRERLFKDRDHSDLANSLHNMGYVLESLGQADKALPFCERALAMYERLFKDRDHPDLANSLNGVGCVLQSLGQADKALPVYGRALTMRERLFKDQDHPDLANSLNNLGSVLEAMGQVERALPFYDRALKMRERLFKDRDHPDLANSLNNLGNLLASLGQADKALPVHDRALKMRERLFKDRDHSDLANSLHNMGYVLGSLGQAEKALPFCERALKMRERLSKNQDHPALAISLNNLGSVLVSVGQADKALPLYDRAMKMYERLSQGDDHPDLANSLSNTGYLLASLGQTDKALACWERLFHANHRILTREVAFAPEAEALDRLRTLPDVRGPYLALTRQRRTDDASVVGPLWNARAIVSRVIERRHLAGQDSEPIRAVRASIAAVRAQLTAALLRPLFTPGREDLLQRLTVDKEKLERQLLQLLPLRLRPGQAISPTDLATVLPAEAAYLDILRNEDRDEKGRFQPRYTTFLHTKAKVARIDLGPAQDIDHAANDWRHAILAKVPAPNRAEQQQKIDAFAAKLRELVWDKLAPVLPAELKTVYLTVEGDLGRFPFAALPDGKDAVLLEKYAFVQVPHGPALVEHLRSLAGRDTTGNLLVVGGVEYGAGKNWVPLPGTADERAQLEKLSAGRAKPSLGGTRATTAAVLAALPEVRYAHLATHGQYNAEQFTADQKQLAAYRERLKTFEVGNGIPPRSGLGTRSPLGYVGLVLAGANTPDTAGPDGGILSGEAIAGLQLDKLRLAVLSACETGLGANSDTEGVRGLQRAFHIAGCPAVVASLWEVNDEATAALMNVFWEKVLDKDNPLPPAQALREAQLKVYLNPHLITTLASRGGGFRDLVKVNPDKAPPPPADYKGPRRAPAYLWSAFFLSESGR